MANPTENEPDDVLLEQFRLGSEEAAARLYRRYAHRLHALAEVKSGIDLRSRLDAEDIVQSAFRSFFRRAAGGHYQVPPGEELWKLLLVILLNKIRAAGTYHRAQKRDVSLTSTDTELNSLVAPADGTELSFRDLQLVVMDTLATFPEAQRPIVLLRMEGYEVAEIADQVARSKRTVERVLQDFRKALRKQLVDETP